MWEVYYKSNRKENYETFYKVGVDIYKSSKIK